MADTVITISRIDEITNVSSDRAQIPSFKSGSYANDANYHIARIFTSGKRGFSYNVDNASSVDVQVTLYASYTEDAEIGDASVFPIDSTGFTATAGGKESDTCGDPHPWIFVRTKAASAGNAGLISVYVSVMSE